MNGDRGSPFHVKTSRRNVAFRWVGLDQMHILHTHDGKNETREPRATPEIDQGSGARWQEGE